VNVVKGLVLSSSIFEIMEKNVVGLWEHSLGTAVAANVIAKHLGMKDAEEISTAALLHDIGKVIIKIEVGDHYAVLLSQIQQKEMTMLEAEREYLDIDHAEIGGWLARKWFLPEKLIEPIAFHHDVNRSDLHRTRTAVVHLADALVKAGGFGFSGDEFVPKVQSAAWERLGLSERLLEEIIGLVEDKLVDVRNFSMELQSGNDRSA